MANHNLAPWQVLGSQKSFSAQPWIVLSRHQVRLPNGQVVRCFVSDPNGGCGKAHVFRAQGTRQVAPPQLEGHGGNGSSLNDAC
jgi:hypothetical protein